MMEVCEDSYIEVLKESLASVVELGITADDYIHQIETVYGDKHSENIRQLFGQVLEEIPEIDKDKAVSLMKENVDIWDNILEEQMGHFAGYAMFVFRVPKNVLLPSNVKVHEAVESYSAKEDEEIDIKIENTVRNIKKKQAYLKMLSIQAAKLDVQKSVLFDKRY